MIFVNYGSTSGAISSIKKITSLCQNNPDAIFYCIKCTEENIPFSSLNDNQYKIVVEKGVNYTGEVNVQFEPNPIEQQFFIKINNAIKRLSFEFFPKSPLIH